MTMLFEVFQNKSLDKGVGVRTKVFLIASH